MPEIRVNWKQSMSAFTIPLYDGDAFAGGLLGSPCSDLGRGVLPRK